MMGRDVYELFLRIGGTCLDEDLETIVDACLAMALEAAGRKIGTVPDKAAMDEACAILDQRCRHVQQIAKASVVPLGQLACPKCGSNTDIVACPVDDCPITSVRRVPIDYRGRA